MGGKRIGRLATAAAIFAILLLFTLPLWSARNLLYMGDVVNSDVTELNYPARELLADSLRDWRLPAWNPYIGCGFPQLAEGQSGMLYPPNLALFGLLSPVLAFNLSVVLSLLLALVFSYLLLREYGASRPASLFAATAFAFSGFMMAKLKFTYMINAVCWVPLAVYGVERTFSGRHLGYLLLTTLALAMQVLAGGPQVLVITLTAVVVVFAWRYVLMLSARGKKAAPAGRRGAAYLPLAMVLCLLLAAALSAPQLLPLVKGYPYSTRAVEQSFGWSLGVPMQPRHLVQFVSPYQYGNPARATYDLGNDFFWEDVAYPGLLTLVLALVAMLFLAGRDRTLQMWLLVGAIALALSLAAHLPFAEWLWKYAPGFKLFRFWQRYLALVVLATAVLAGKGLDYVLARFKDRRTRMGLMVILVFAVLLTDLALFSYNQVSTIDSRRMLEGNRTADWLRERLGDDGGGYRIAVMGERDAWREAVEQSGGWLGGKGLFYQFMELLPSNHNALFRLCGASQYGEYGLYRNKMLDTLATYFYVRGEGWNADISRSAVNVLAMQSVRYLVTPLVLEEEGLRRAATMDTDIRGMDIHIYELTQTMPPAFVTQGYVLADIGDTVSHQSLMEALWDMRAVRERVFLETRPSLRFGPAPAGEARIAQRDERRVVIDADSPGGGILVLRQSYYPEWRVFVDGEERGLLRADFAFCAVELEPGTHVVEFVYRPASFYCGIPVCAAAFVLLLLFLLQHRRTAFMSLDRPVRAPSAAEDPGRAHSE